MRSWACLLRARHASPPPRPLGSINALGWGPREARPPLQQLPALGALRPMGQDGRGPWGRCFPARREVSGIWGGGGAGARGWGVAKGRSRWGALMPPALTPRAPGLHEETQRQLPGRRWVSVSSVPPESCGAGEGEGPGAWSPFASQTWPSERVC